ncbi:MAG: hypothetical protein M1821_004489 [Bathelium mastoideum]|nr:MAG: hypothetical protein M1821_004489 [Bathelium mastoideum]
MGLGLVTAAFCLVRTVLNVENVNQDSTWESVPNWYYRSWEVNIGIIAACIPALRPGYRAVTTAVRSYASMRSSNRHTSASHKRFHGPSDSDPTVDAKYVDGYEDKLHLAKELVMPGVQPDEGAMNFARHEASVEADRARAYGGGDEGFAMGGLKGDLGTVEQGIKKTTWFDVDRGSSTTHIERNHSESGLGSQSDSYGDERTFL